MTHFYLQNFRSLTRIKQGAQRRLHGAHLFNHSGGAGKRRKEKADCVMSKRSCLIIWICAAPIGWAQQTVTVGQVGPFVPAGTLLGCTLDEPNFSSQTARVGDPVLCKTTASVVMFGHSLIPRGAYLSGRLKNYRDPGHFVGKGWIQLEFTSLTLPGGSVPLDAKVISAARYRVNGDGKIQGRGHATRDAVEWAIPVLWPVKVLTLPARGPRPTLKSETRIELRLMEDLLIPESVYATSSVLTPQPSAVQPGADVRDAIFWRGNTRLPTHQAVTSTSNQSPATNRGLPSAQPRPTLLILRGGRVYLVTDYWVDRGNLDYITGSAVHALPLDALDLPMTQQLNAERGVPFTLATKER